MNPAFAPGCALALLCCLLPACAIAASDPGLPAAPQMQFTPPAAGTYSLQRIQRAADGVLLDPSSHPHHLLELTRGRITLLTFFYTRCDDPLGCPFALGLMSTLRMRVLADPELKGAVRFVSISFDPSRDAPAQLRRYGGSLIDDPRFEWRFLTARSHAELQPLLQGYGQDVRVTVDGQGRPQRAINHLLKLFLIDAAGIVREIYTLDYLQVEEMLNDMRTLRREAVRRPGAS
jgi:cytochrome oxidase Cu insertion factor (SCO1/SenC/PrrC family)